MWGCQCVCPPQLNPVGEFMCSNTLTSKLIEDTGEIG